MACVSGEASRLCWTRFNLDYVGFHVVRLKNGVTGDHPLRGVEIRDLRRLKREGPHAGEYVVGSERGGPITPEGVQQIVDRAARAAGLGELNIHPRCLRHSCGHYLSEAGADLRVIQAYLGHREISPHSAIRAARARAVRRPVGRLQGGSDSSRSGLAPV
jgi:integrase